MCKLRKKIFKKIIKTGQNPRASELKLGQLARVKKIFCKNLALRQRILDMGVTIGVVIKIKKIAPLGDPISIEIRGYELILRLCELKDIEVEVI